MNLLIKFICFTLVYFTISAALASEANPPENIFGKKFDAKEINHVVNDNKFIAGILGGKNSSISKFRYLAAINREDRFIGSAIILNKYWLVTAAWNIFWAEGNTFTVRVGSSYAKQDGKVYKVKSSIIHPNYTYEWIYDIALLKVEEPIKFSKTVNKISLASKLPSSGSIAVVSGWGWDKLSDPGTQILKAASLPYIDYKTCEPSYNDTKGFTPYSICTRKAGVGPCAKDFGSPLVYKKKLIGVYSGAYECGGYKYPGVYADITKYKKWIEKSIKKSSKNEEVNGSEEDEEEEVFDEDEISENEA